MTKFEGGPAQGQVLMLQRSPLFLRVALDPNALSTEKAWDALDQFEDYARPGETFYAYRRAGEPAHCDMKFGAGSKRQSGFYALARYIYIPAQPTQDVMASNESWRSWCIAAAAAKVGAVAEIDALEHAVMPAADQCKSCNALIAWLRTPAGKTIPVDYATIQPGDVEYDKARHMSHFGTCPQASKWSRKKKKETA